jgi:hypothetical protein
MKVSMKIKDDRVIDPGWAVQFEDGSWLGGAHGWFRSDDAFYADVYESKEDAQRYLDYLRKDKSEGGAFDLPAQIVPAWQPQLESLRVEVRSLKQANRLTPSKLMDITMNLESVLYDLKQGEDD